MKTCFLSMTVTQKGVPKWLIGRLPACQSNAFECDIISSAKSIMNTNDFWLQTNIFLWKEWKNFDCLLIDLTWGLATEPVLAYAISMCNEVTTFLQDPSRLIFELFFVVPTIEIVGEFEKSGWNQSPAINNVYSLSKSGIKFYPSFSIFTWMLLMWISKNGKPLELVLIDKFQTCKNYCQLYLSKPIGLKVKIT